MYNLHLDDGTSHIGLLAHKYDTLEALVSLYT